MAKKTSFPIFFSLRNLNAFFIEKHLAINLAKYNNVNGKTRNTYHLPKQSLLLQYCAGKTHPSKELIDVIHRHSFRLDPKCKFLYLHKLYVLRYDYNIYIYTCCCFFCSNSGNVFEIKFIPTTFVDCKRQ